MKEHSFQLSANSEFIPLDKLLKIIGLVGTGGEAHIRIVSGEVEVNGVIETQKRKKMRVGDVARFAGNTITIKE